ncbi:MAG: PAS domain S-box protein [Desulfobacter sp.]|nr:MAG: PAS domain S-box protein [Desulfobacter sp.]
MYENKPKVFTDPEGEVRGFWPELIASIASKENWDIRYVHGSWNENLERLIRNEIDLMPDVAFTEKRNRIYRFSHDAVLMSWSRVYVKKENTRIQSITDLKKKKIAVLKGSVNFEGADGIREIVQKFHVDCTFLECDSYDKVFEAVENNLADAGVTNRNFGNKNEEKYNLKKTAVIFQPISIKFAFTKGGRLTENLSGKIDSHMARLFADSDSIYYELLENYFETKIAQKTVEIIPTWAMTVLKSAGAVFSILVLVLFLSRLQVKRKTREIAVKNNALAESEGFLRTLIETIPDLIWLKDPEGRYLSCNKKFERFFGAKESDIIGKTDYDFVDEALADFFREKDKLAIASNGPTINQEDVTFADDGHKELLETIKTPMYDNSGNLIGVLGVARDITRLKRSEKRIREEKEFTEAALNSQRDTFFLFEPATGKAIRWNDAFCRISGYTNDEIARMKAPESYYSPADLKKALPFVEMVTRTGFGTIELDLICKNGRKIPTEYNVAVIRDDRGDPKYLISSGRDLTERKQLELRFQQLAENSSDWIWEFDEDTVFTYSSPGVIRLLGYTPEEVVGKSALDLIPSHEKEKSARAFARIRDRHEPFSRFETINQRKDGRLVTIESSGSPIFNSDGEFKGYRGIDRDISERKRIEEELRQSQKMESIGTLSSGIAHDFNNILGIILGNAELALNALPESDNAHGKIKKIKTASLRAKDVVRQLLRFSRRIEKHRKPIDISSIVNETIKLIRSSIPANIEIQARIPQTVDTILADATQIHQVLINLCTNASHAMRDTGGVLEISLDTVDVGDGEKDVAPGRYIELGVKDTGPGIDPAIRDKIFDPYFTTKEVGKGTGMGLSVVHGIVKNHDGKIGVQSEPGKGARFSIIFPTIEEKPQTESEIPVKKLEIPGKERILFVDDEASLVDIADEILTALNYEVQVSTSPVDALALFAEAPDRFDLVITDLTMPQMNGVQLSRELKRLRPDLPIIICTGNHTLMDEKEAEKAGISAYAMKPITMSEISNLISALLKA